MMIYKLSTGDEVHRYQKSIVIPFKDKRKVLSTAPSNGGYREDLKWVFNQDANPGAGMACKLKAPTYREHMYMIAGELGLDGDYTAGISTAASMENVAIKTEVFDEVTVTAIVTGGIEVNGGRAGDPASFYEKKGKFEKIKEGTINIILVIDADLPEGTMARALVTCTEAKTAAIQELMAGSNYSRGLATGSGTDGTIIVCNSQSDVKLSNAGKHSKLGELIGLSVKKAVKEALFLQTGLCARSQHSFLRRMKRFGINEDKIWNEYKTIININEENNRIHLKPEFLHELHSIDDDEYLVTLTSLYAHLLDQLDWGLLDNREVLDEGNFMLNRIYEKFNIEQAVVNEEKIYNESTDEVIEYMVNKLMVAIINICGGMMNV